MDGVVEVHGRARTSDTFDEFVMARSDALWRAAWLLTLDSHLAEDLVQTALSRCYRHFDRLGSTQFEAYVRRSIFNTFATATKRRWWGEVPTEQVPEHPSADVDLDVRSDLVRALRGLPPGQRAVVVLRYFEDLTERETADLLGCSVGTVKSQNSRALRALRISTSLE